MKILAIETSCDETGAAVVQSKKNDSVEILSNVVATSLALHAKTGGIIPEVAAREQSRYIIPVVHEALQKAGLSDENPTIDAVAVTYGPGLIGSLLVGVETAKTLSFTWKKPLIPVNHLFGHIYANWLIGNRESGMGESNDTAKRAISDKPFTTPEFPLIALIVSGAHTDLLYMKNHADFVWLGGTRDDAAGECFDKSGRLLGLPYPAGPAIERLAKLGNPKTYHFPRPLLHEKNYDFSFSGLKTAILREVQELKKEEGEKMNDTQINDLCWGIQDAIIDILVTKTLKAAEEYDVRSILISGGVAASETLQTAFREALDTKYKILNTKFFAPAKNLSTDNAAMIGAAAIYQGKEADWEKVTANPELYFD